MKYSTALTSWLVVRSMSLTRAASAVEKPSASASRRFAAAAGNGASSGMPGSAASASNHSTSTRTRAWISPFSENTGRNASTRSEEHTSELQSLMRISYAVLFLNINNITYMHYHHQTHT